MASSADLLGSEPLAPKEVAPSQASFPETGAVRPLCPRLRTRSSGVFHVPSLGHTDVGS